jgi:hypothetical protein
VKVPSPSPSPSSGGGTEVDVGSLLLTGIALPVVAALIVALILWIVGRASRRHPFRAIARAVRGAWRWGRGLKPLVTSARWHLQFDRGFAARSAEVAAERATVPQPSWAIHLASSIGSGSDAFLPYTLMNWGYAVRDVRLSAPADSFIFERDPFFAGDVGTDQPGGGTGPLFSGRPTDLGRNEGVRFELTWSDRHGDRHSASAILPPQTEPIETPEAAYLRGRREERQEAETRRKTALEPRWVIYATDDYDGTFVLENVVESSAPRTVRVDPFGTGFRIVSAATWNDVPGGARVLFSGQVLSRQLEDVQLKVSWVGLDGFPTYVMVTPGGPPGA